MKLAGTIAWRLGRERRRRHPSELEVRGEQHNTEQMDAYLGRIDSQAAPICTEPESREDHNCLGDNVLR